VAGVGGTGNWSPERAATISLGTSIESSVWQGGVPDHVLTMYVGGTLHYDIPRDVPGAGPHRLAETDERHDLVVESDSRLGAILGPAPDPVNSLHHQAVADPGPRLRVAAHAGDGLIEAIELEEDSGFCLGVQWHPEKLRGPHRDLLFTAFVAACAATRRSVESD